MRQLWSDNLTNLSTTYNQEQGKFGMFEIRYAGEAQAGNTVSLSDLGTVRLNENGDDTVNVDVEFLSLAADNWGGFVEASSTIGGAFSFSIFIPAGYWFDKKNVFWFNKTDEVYWQLQFPVLTSAYIASGNVIIYGNPSNGAQSYRHRILSKQVVSSASSGTINDTISERNIIALYLKNPTALISDLMLTRDKNVVVNGAMVAEQAYSNWIHELEVASTLYIAEFAPDKLISQALSNQFAYQYLFTSAGNLAQYYSAIKFTPDRQKASVGL